MKIIIHRGENQIGGNIIEISTESTRILLDAGLEFDPEKNRELPGVDGLFDRKGFDAVFITHYHSDHLGLAYKIHPDIPLYIGEMSYRITRASDRYRHVRGIAPAGFLRDREPVTIGDITVTPYLCDHSAFDSYMLLCEAGGERILYTGDFRSNGRKSYDRLLSVLPTGVDVLICEGTTLSREGYVARTEAYLEKWAVKLMSEYDGPVFVLQSTANIDRIVTMYRAAKQTGRIFLQELYMANITAELGGDIPNPGFDDVFPFIAKRERYLELHRYKNRVGRGFISKSRFVMCVRTNMLDYMKKLSKKMSFANGLLIYSFWTGYKEQEDMKAFLNDCEQMGLTVKTLHTSGHADTAAIEKLIETVKPKKIMPVHTIAAEWFEGREAAPPDPDRQPESPNPGQQPPQQDWPQDIPE